MQPQTPNKVQQSLRSDVLPAASRQSGRRCARRYVAAVIALIAQFFSLHTFALSVQCLQSEPPASNVMNVRVHAEMTAEVELPAMLNKEPLRELWLLYEVEQQGVRKTIESQLPTTISDNTARASCSAESTWPNLSLMAFYGAECGPVLAHDFAT